MADFKKYLADLEARIEQYHMEDADRAVVWKMRFAGYPFRHSIARLMG